MCAMTFSHVRHVAFTCATRLVSCYICCTCECDMSHVWLRHVAQVSARRHMWMRHVPHVMLHMWIRHVARVNTSWHTCQCASSWHRWYVGNLIHIIAPCHTCGWVTRNNSCICDMTQYMCHDSLISGGLQWITRTSHGKWLVYIRHDSIYVPWLTHVSHFWWSTVNNEDESREMTRVCTTWLNIYAMTHTYVSFLVVYSKLRTHKSFSFFFF